MGEVTPEQMRIIDEVSHAAAQLCSMRRWAAMSAYVIAGCFAALVISGLGILTTSGVVVEGAEGSVFALSGWVVAHIMSGVGIFLISRMEKKATAIHREFAWTSLAVAHGLKNLGGYDVLAPDGYK